MSDPKYKNASQVNWEEAVEANNYQQKKAGNYNQQKIVIAQKMRTINL